MNLLPWVGAPTLDNNLGRAEMENGSMHRAIKHLMIAACAGYDSSMDTVQAFMMKGMISNEDYETTLKAWKMPLME